MLWKHISAAAGLAATTTNALLLPPEVTETDRSLVDGIFHALPFHAADTATSAQSLKVPCPGCPVEAGRHAGNVNAKAANHLDFDFSIDHSEGHDRLLVNGYELYPDMFPKPLYAIQALDHEAKDSATDDDLVKLGFLRRTEWITERENDQAFSLVNIDVRVFQVGPHNVDTVPPIHVQLIEGANHELYLHEVKTVEPEVVRILPAHGPGSDDKMHPGHHHKEPEHPHHKTCQSVFCSWRNSIVNGFNSLRPNCGAHKKHPEDHRGPHSFHQGAPDHAYHGHPPFDKHHHSWGRLLSNVTSSIILPILVGLVAGVSVAIFGMMVGTVVVFFYRLAAGNPKPWMRSRCSRRSARQHRNKVSKQEEAALAEEKSGLLESQDAEGDVEGDELPAYKEEEDNSTRL